MACNRRSYLLPRTGEHITFGKIKKLSADQQIEMMRHWFDDRYTWPNELPYDTGEGGYPNIRRVVFAAAILLRR